ncbi:MAG: GTP 3',8-cyclase MoaA [Candidatus Sericytochromatia bacterium]|nr:GTP 3',8-cyclase MoaA [Candidatus Tanganyikabacteria bacterium]
MQDRLGRRIDYLRISVTDRCNMRCRYCMPEEGMEWFGREHLLTYEELARVVREVFVPLGLEKVRLTGGEPLLRRDLPDLVAMLREIPQIRDIALSTNAALLAEYAPALKRAGLDRVNISLDSLDPERFSRITRGGNLERVLRGLDRALELEFHPVKLNSVIIPGENDDEMVDLAHLTLDRPVHLRFIEFMPVGDRDLHQRRGTFGVEDMLERLREHFSLEPVAAAPRGNGPARYWRIAGSAGTLGFIHPMSRHFCDTCNRFRLTADGRAKSCLLVSSERDLRGALRAGASNDELRQIVLDALALKPDWHEMGTEAQALTMSQIGG